MVKLIPTFSLQHASVPTVTVFLTRSVFDWRPGGIIAGQEVLNQVNQEPMIVMYRRRVWIGTVRPNGNTIKIQPEGEAVFYLPSAEVRLFTITQPPSESGHCLYECNIKGVTENTSPELNQLFGLSADKMAGDGWQQAVGKNDDERAATAHRWQDAVESLSLYQARYTVTNQTTGEQSRHCTLAAIEHKRGKPSLYRGIVLPE